MPDSAVLSAYYRFDRCQDLEESGDWPQAEAGYREILAAEGSPASIRYGACVRLAICREASGTLEQAIDLYRRCVNEPGEVWQAWPEAHSLALYRLALALKRTGAFYESAQRFEALGALLPVAGLNNNEVRAAVEQSRVLTGVSTEDANPSEVN